MEGIWWKIRGAVDSYVDEAENEISSILVEKIHCESEV